MTERLEQQMTFLAELDKMKTILRRTMLIDKSKRENDAEHSWHFATMAMILKEYAAAEVDIDRVIRMALVHDLVEIYAGDTFAYDEAGYEDKEAREREAADKLFGMLPADQCTEIRSLWEEFEAMETADALYASAIDRLQPFLNNVKTEGFTWQEGHVTREKVYLRMGIVEHAIPALWPFVQESIEQAVQLGYLKP